MTYDHTNIFARIIRGEIPCQRVYENEYMLAFHDIHPKAPIHVLSIPKGPFINFADFIMGATPEENLSFWEGTSRLIQELGLREGGYRLLTNSGASAGQEVPHFHLHILAGKNLGPLLAPSTK